MEELLRNNEEYVAGFAYGQLEARPRLKLAVLTCMDARIDPLRILGLAPGDVHVLRNAGGVITDDVIRSLTISQQELGSEEILVIQHTQCGLLRLSDEDFARRVEARTGARPPWPALAFSDLEASARDAVARLHAEVLLPHRARISGLIYEIETGRLREVETGRLREVP